MHEFIINILIILCIIIVFALVITAISHIFIAVPFVPTPKKVVNTMVDFADLKNGDTVYDIGAGDGRILIAAKKRMSSIVAIGIEFIPTVWFLGKLRILFSGLDIKFLLGDALKKDLSGADCIILYLIPSMMAKLEKKFDCELKPGTRVISYAFYFQNRTPVKDMVVPWIFGERKLRMYIWGSSNDPKK